MSAPADPANAASINAADPTDAIEPHILAKLDPDFVKYYAEVLSKVPPAQAVSVEQVRANPDKFRAPIAVDTAGWERVVDGTVQSEDGAEVPVRLYYPDPAVRGEGPYPAHLNFHGESFSHLDIYRREIANSVQAVDLCLETCSPRLSCA